MYFNYILFIFFCIEELSELTDDSSLEGETLPLQDDPSYKGIYA